MKKIFMLLGLPLILMGCHRTEEAKQETKKSEIPMVHLMTADDSKSLYQLSDVFVNQDGDTVYLQDFAGKPLIVSMIFTSCAGACPRIVADLQKIESTLDSKENQSHFLLISFDSNYDQPAVLKKYAQKHKLGKNWTLLNGSASAVRTLSVLLDVAFSEVEKGVFSHDNKISVLDQSGILRFQEEGLGNDPEIPAQAVHQLLAD